jgi:Kef-type K+ transport system membrane component KefB
MVAARKTKLTPVLYYLAVGAILVNIGVLPKENHAFIRGFAEIGTALIMFALGFEESTSNFLASIKRSWGVAFFGGVALFLTTYFVADYFWNDTEIALICGLAMTATWVSLAMVPLKAEKLNGSRDHDLGGDRGYRLACSRRHSGDNCHRRRRARIGLNFAYRRQGVAVLHHHCRDRHAHTAA